MALVVETGEGLSNADALISLSDTDAYHSTRGHATWTGTNGAKEEAIRRATQYLSSAVVWGGVRTRGRDQSLAWPRGGLFDREGWDIDDNEIPIEVEQACAELALIELTTPGALSPSVAMSDGIKREKVGQIEVEYANALAGAWSHIPSMPLVQALIAPFVSKLGGASSIQGETAR